MYYCKKCGKPITEFDVAFGKHAVTGFDVNDCNCVECQTEGGVWKLIKNVYFRKEEVKLHIDTVVVIGMCAITLSIAGIFYDWVLDNSMDAKIASGIFCAILTIYSLVKFCAYIIQILEMHYREYYGETYIRGTHIESTIDSSGTIHSKEVSEYGGGNRSNMFSMIVLFCLSPLWFIPHFIYLLLAKPISNAILKSTYPKIYKACDMAKETTVYYEIAKEEYARFNSLKKEYDKKVSKITDKYSIYGENEVKNQLSSLTEPIFYTTINSKKYIVANELNGKSRKKHNNLYVNYTSTLILSKSQEGNIEYIALYNGYKVYDCDWKNIGYGEYNWLFERIKEKLPFYEQALLSNTSFTTETKNKI